MLKRFITENTAKAAIYVMFTVAVFGALFFARSAHVYSAFEEDPAPPASSTGGAPASQAEPEPEPAKAQPPGNAYSQARPAAGSQSTPASAATEDKTSADDPGEGEAPTEDPAPEDTAEELPPLELGEDMPDPEALEAELERLSAMGLSSKLPDIINLEYMGDYYATAYCCEVYPHICGGNGVTASGTAPTPGLTAAADWKVLPPGTWLYIEGVGIRRVEDSGSAIKSKRLDIAIDTHDNALRWRGLGYHRVWVLAWDNTRLLR